MENLASQIYESPEMTVAQMIEYRIGPNLLKVYWVLFVHIIKSKNAHHIDELRVVFMVSKYIRHVMKCSTATETSLKRVDNQF